MSHFSLIIPAYNASLFLESVLNRIPRDFWEALKSVWIINDGSNDNTSEVVNNLCKKFPKIKYIEFATNRGYGTAVKEGLQQCIHESCDFCGCLHADGQYPPEYVETFFIHMQYKKFDILQGSRIASGTALQGGMPLYKYCAGKVLTFMENRVFNLSLTDYHSGYIFYSKRFLRTIPFCKLSSSFDFDLEMIASARSHKLSIGELPIPTHYGAEISYLNPIPYGIRVLGVMIKYIFGYYRRLV